MTHSARARTGLLVAVVCAVLAGGLPAACSSSQSHSGPAAGTNDGTVTGCQQWPYGTFTEVDVSWQVTNSGSGPQDYKLFVNATQKLGKEVDIAALAPGYQKMGTEKLVVTPAADGSWPVINCTVTAVPN